ncbi:hypothetical protein, partial [Bradyrhizobium liaoningense]|uniref:hypothetical protein n=1 Tax=Bradyrhizobium liaoningense TaxID=43992 RepID=UPI001AEBC724
TTGASSIVVIEVDKLRRQGVATDEALFEQVGEKLGIPTGTTRSFYYEDNAALQCRSPKDAVA